MRFIIAALALMAMFSTASGVASYQMLGEGGVCRLTPQSTSSSEPQCMTNTQTNSKSECEQLCTLDDKCLAIEMNPEGNHCEMWICLPKYTEPSSGWECKTKIMVGGSVAVDTKPITGNYMHLSAASVAVSIGETVNAWTDSSSGMKNFEVLSDCVAPVLGQASWDSSIPVLDFGHSSDQNCLKSVHSHDVPVSATFAAVISWTGKGGSWEPIAVVSHDDYWSVRMYSSTQEINMHVRNEQTPRKAIELNTPYIVVGRVDDSNKMSYMWVWDIAAGDWKGKSSETTQGIPAGGDEVITIGRSTIKNSYGVSQWLQGELALFAMWDYSFTDDEVNALVEQYKVNYGQGVGGSVAVDKSDRRLMTIGVGYFQVCLINNNKEIKCYGWNSHSQVSNAPTIDTYNFISSGAQHNCAISCTTSKITCWGLNNKNQVSDTPTSDTYNFISSGYSHNCAISSTTSKITCWGLNDKKQVTDTPTSDTYNFISSGGLHNCAISSTTSKITCWGNGNFGQVSRTPTSDTYNFISSGYEHNCAISSTTSKITCWGYDLGGAVSNAPTIDTYNFLSSGFYHNCAISSTTSKITCWGRDSENQVTDTPTSDTYNFISSGSYTNCAISTTTSKITCWGGDEKQQVSGPNTADLQILSPFTHHGGVVAAVDGGFSDWSACDATCGAGKRTRTCDDPAPTDGGADCVGDLSEDCNIAACPIDGGFSDWGACDATCGTGKKSRACDNPAAANGGADCVGDLSEDCNIAACPINGGLSDNWSSCSVTCGTGIQTKSCDNPAPDHGGDACSGVTSQNCNINVCPERCVVNFHDTITNANDCECGPNTETVCAKTEFCYASSKVDDEETCTADKYRSCTEGVDKNVFYGGKVLGEWLKDSNQIKMYVKTPFDIQIKSIVWQTASYTAMDDSTLKYSSSDASVSNQWTVAGGTNEDPCKRSYGLTVPTATYFGDGSEFTMTHVAEKYCLQSSIKVTAEQKREFTPSGLTTPYKYTRKIVNTMPIIVELQTTSTVNVKIKMVVGTKPRNEFVLFVGGEEGIDGGKEIVTIYMLSFSPHGLKNIADGGVTISAGSDKIKADSSVFSETPNQDPENFDIDLNMVKDMITWKFEPVESYHESSYTIRLKFHDKVTSDTWEADSEIHISKTDLMAEVGFQTDISLYSDRQCEIANTQFETSKPIYAKLTLSNQIVAIETIACTAFIVRQYSNPKVEGEAVLVEKKMKEESGLFSFNEGPLNNANGDAIANTWVCGADLDSAFFKVSIDGYPAELTVEVTVTYKTDGATIRRILSVPVVTPWVIENAEQLSQVQIEDIQRILAEEDVQTLGVAIGEAAETGKAVAETGATELEPTMLKASFTITAGHKTRVESGVAAMKTVAEEDYTNIGMKMLFGAGFFCVGLSIYICSSTHEKSGEYTYLLNN